MSSARSLSSAAFHALALPSTTDGRFQLVLSPYLLAEVEQTLREPAVRALRKLTDSQIKGFIGALAEVAQVVEGAYAVNLVARDPDDNPVVACAWKPARDTS
jgi:predicted nucleic acid-binding protein